jgi:hypothetical protein
VCAYACATYSWSVPASVSASVLRMDRSYRWTGTGPGLCLWWLPTRRKACMPRLGEDEEGGEGQNRHGMACYAGDFLPLSPAAGRWVGETVRVYTEPLENGNKSVFSYIWFFGRW